ncbi:MAG: sulfotransferase domain-containing protein [Acetobacteraceae bacterium]
MIANVTFLRAAGRELRILGRALCDRRSCLLSKLVLLLGIAYLFVPIDLIPDRLPLIGHLDELSFVAFAFAGSRRLVPPEFIALSADESLASGDSWESVRFFVRILRADLANFFLLQYRDVDGFLITGKNSGTHWLKFMLSCALAEQFGVAPPRRSSGQEADSIIGHPRSMQNLPVPRIASSHTIPSIAFAWRFVNRLCPHPPVVVLVRDIEAAMRSNYVKWRSHYGASATDYVRGDPSGRRYVADVWWYMHFFNRWGDVLRAQPENVLLVHYEDLQAAPAIWLRRIAAHYGIELSSQAIAAAMRYVERDAIRIRLDPHDTEIVVPSEEVRRSTQFAPEDAALIGLAIRRHLRCDLGYGYPAMACSNTPV